MITSSVIWTSFGTGLAGGIDSLSTTAIGNGNHRLAGLYYNRSIVIFCIIFIPQIVFLWHAGAILAYIGQPKESAELAGEYLRIFIFGIWCFCQGDLLRRFLCAQGVFSLISKCQLVTTVFHLVLLYVLIYLLDMGVQGIMIANTISYSLGFLLPYLYVTFNQSVLKKGSWVKFDKESFQGLCEYLKFGIPAMLMTWLEFWSFELLILIAGYLGTNELGTSILVMNVINLSFSCAISIAIATSTYVGNCFGALKPYDAKIYFNISVAMSVIKWTTFSILMLTYPQQIAELLTNNEAIIALTVKVIPIICVLFYGDSMQGITCAIIRSMGYQQYAHWFSIVWYGLIAFPLGAFCGFYLEMGVNGIWLGQCIGICLLSTVLLIMIYSTDFKQLSQSIVKRINETKGEENGRKTEHFDFEMSVSGKSLLDL